ncbi:hypothetical protein DOY81_012281, partial [Sarcophaga bullata]
MKSFLSVVHSYSEPAGGWIDNLNGIGGALAAYGFGVTPAFCISRGLILDLVPVDFVTRLTLTATYKKGLETLNKNSNDEQQYSLEMYFLNLPISIILDSVLRLLGRNPMLLKVQRRIMYSSTLVENFSSKAYDIPYDNLIKNDFGVKLEYTYTDFAHVAKYFVIGFKEYMFNEPPQA